VVRAEDVALQRLRRPGVVRDEELALDLVLEQFPGRRVARDERVLLLLLVVLLGFRWGLVEAGHGDDSGPPEDGHPLVPPAVVLAPRPDDAVEQGEVEGVEPVRLREAPPEGVLHGEAVVDDAAGPLGVLERALLVADDAEHRVPGLALGGRDDARLGERPGEVVVRVLVEEARLDRHPGVDPLAEPARERVRVGFGGRRAVEDDLLDHSRR